MPKSIGKSTFDYLANLKEEQFEKLLRGLLSKISSGKSDPRRWLCCFWCQNKT
jgi:hypothetical protein